MDLTQILLGVLAMGVTGDVALRCLFKSDRRIADARADSAEISARGEEFKFLREQVELNQQQNLELTKTNVSLVASIREKEERFGSQTDRLRETQRDLLSANERIVSLTRRVGQLETRLATQKMWRCENSVCSTRLPPNPLLKGMSYRE